ncbi:hypothetical protein GGR44_003282 [Sphingobium fontiphilum]|uniref:SHOCT domain-containing protein n=1 Tax=Sphingobium fontiphilum TaxID=944425 RepID=A0A7W6DHX9_9SPHN|nr:SHOCT domain-containing protein [Sphingobium fontiphilum]MBB3983586.1 hypothetical protein [Sphingobium fontiphilum]
MDDQLTQLERLALLHAQGALTQEEFAAEKARILSAAHDQTPERRTGTWDKPRAETKQPPRKVQRKTAMIALAGLAGLIGAGSYYVLRGQDSTSPAASEPPTSLPAPSPTPTPAASTDMAPATAMPLDDSIQFANAANCEASKGTEALFNNILTPPQGDVANISAKPIRVGPDQIEIIPAFNKQAGEGSDTVYESVATFPQPSTWHGLRVTGVSASLYVIPEADSTYTRQIRFKEDPGALRAALNRQGFNLPRAPAYAELQDDACGGSMQIVDMPEGSALQCSWGC